MTIIRTYNRKMDKPVESLSLVIWIVFYHFINCILWSVGEQLIQIYKYVLS
eukprot:UN04798